MACREGGRPVLFVHAGNFSVRHDTGDGTGTPAALCATCAQSQSQQFACGATVTSGPGLAWWRRGRPDDDAFLSLGLQRLSPWSLFSALPATDWARFAADHRLDR